MKNNTFSLTSRDGLNLFAQSWQGDQAVKAVVCLVHGLGEHSGRYTHVAQALTDAGYAVISFDQRGHGQSGGARGHLPDEAAPLNDIDLLIQAAEQRYPGLPRFLYGHSLGGLWVLYYSLKRRPDVRGVVSTSPALLTPLREQKLKVMLSKILGRLSPSTSLASGLDANLISHDPQVIQTYLADPLVHDRVTFGFGAQVLKIVDWTLAHAAEFPVPLLLMHGAEDQITYAEGSRQFAAQVKTPVTLKVWDGLKHETHNEPQQSQVLQTLTTWLDATL